MLIFTLYFADNVVIYYFFFFQADDCIRVLIVTGVQTCALPILRADRLSSAVAHDGKFVQPGLSARREPQSQPYPDTERRARRKPKDQNDVGPGRDQGLFGRNK